MTRKQAARLQPGAAVVVQLRPGGDWCAATVIRVTPAGGVLAEVRWIGERWAPYSRVYLPEE